MRTWLTVVGFEDREKNVNDCVWTVEAEFFPRFPRRKECSPTKILRLAQ